MLSQITQHHVEKSFLSLVVYFFYSSTATPSREKYNLGCEVTQFNYFYGYLLLPQ